MSANGGENGAMLYDTIEPSLSSTLPADDGEEYLDLADQKNRPEDIPIHTQSINAWHPILDPNWVIVTYLILAAIMIPFGKWHFRIDNSTVVDSTNFWLSFSDSFVVDRHLSVPKTEPYHFGHRLNAPLLAHIPEHTRLNFSFHRSNHFCRLSFGIRVG